MSMMQTLQNKKGEVEFRKKLAKQFLGKDTLYPDEPSQEEFSQIIIDRVANYKLYFNRLKKNSILKYPYLELGGGVGQAAMLLENEYNLEGFTSDISFETLIVAKQYKKTLGYKKMPLRICCDIYNLPFQTGSIPFIFTFQTLHHFPDPLPICKEIKRILAPGGHFYFNEEPITQKWNLNLWRRRTHLNWFEKILKKLIILHFISRIGKSETEHNILEETFSLTVWERALGIFPKVSVYIKAFPFGPTMQQTKKQRKNWMKASLYKQFMLDIMGGGLEAICQNENNKQIKKKNNIFDYLACPACKEKPKLYFTKVQNEFFCKKCHAHYKIKNDILILLTKKQIKLFYPHLL